MSIFTNEHAAYASKVVLVLLGLALPQQADAQSTWNVEWERDVPILVVEGAIAVAWTLGDQLAPAHCAPQCDPNDVWAIDRGTAGYWSPEWTTASDIGVASTFVFTAGALWAGEGTSAALVDAVVILQAVGATAALTSLTTLAARRPRPHVYGDKSPVSERNRGRATLSFFSGHSANAFAAVTSTAYTLYKRDPNSIAPWITLAVGGAMAAFVATGRVLGGHHFPSDVLIGAAVGASMGIIVPSMHEQNVRLVASANDDGATVGFGMQF